MAEDISFEISMPARSWLNNRNGTPDIIGLVVSKWRFNDEVWLRGVSTRGKILRGGLMIGSLEAMDELCKIWLQKRGLL